MHWKTAAAALSGLAIVGLAAGAQAQPAPAGDAAALERGVRAFYVTYFSSMKKDAGALSLPFDDSLAALERKAVGDDALPFDPFCGCQDYDMKNLAVAAQSVTPQSAVVVARFVNFGRNQQVTYKLTQTPRGWRISDIVSPEGYSLRTTLAEMAK